MASPIPYEIRVKIVDQMRSKGTIKELAKEYNYSIAGVRKIWKQYQIEGESSFHTKYSNCGRTPVYGKKVKRLVTQIRDNEQGTNYVSSKMLSKYPDSPSPHPRTLQRWWAKEETNRAKGRITDKEKKLGLTKPMKLGK